MLMHTHQPITFTAISTDYTASTQGEGVCMCIYESVMRMLFQCADYDMSCTSTHPKPHPSASPSGESGQSEPPRDSATVDGGAEGRSAVRSDVAGKVVLICHSRHLGLFVCGTQCCQRCSMAQLDRWLCFREMHTPTHLIYIHECIHTARARTHTHTHTHTPTSYMQRCQRERSYAERHHGSV